MGWGGSGGGSVVVVLCFVRGLTLVFSFFFAKNNRCVKAMTVGAPSCCVPAIAWDVCAPANCFFQEARVKVGRINIVRPGKKEKEVLREANGLYTTRTTQCGTCSTWTHAMY